MVLANEIRVAVVLGLQNGLSSRKIIDSLADQGYVVSLGSVSKIKQQELRSRKRLRGANKRSSKRKPAGRPASKISDSVKKRVDFFLFT